MTNIKFNVQKLSSFRERSSLSLEYKDWNYGEISFDGLSSFRRVHNCSELKVITSSDPVRVRSFKWLDSEDEYGHWKRYRRGLIRVKMVTESGLGDIECEVIPFQEGDHRATFQKRLSIQLRIQKSKAKPLQSETNKRESHSKCTI